MVKRYLVDFNIKQKLILMFILIVLIPFSIFTILLFPAQSRYIENMAINRNIKEVVQISDLMSNNLLHIKSITKMLYLNNDFNDLLDNENSLIDEAIDKEINTILDSFSAGMNKVNFQSVIITNRNNIYGNVLFKDSLKNFDPATRPWYKLIDNRPTNIIWTKDKVLDKAFTSSGYEYIYIIRELHDRQTWEPFGYLILGISELEIEKMFSGYLTDNSSVYIVDNNNTIISQIDNLNLKDISYLTDNYSHQYMGNHITNIKGRDRLVTHYTIDTTQWKIYSITDLNTLLSHFNSISKTFLYLVITFLLVSIVIAVVSLTRFLNPINELYKVMDKIKVGNFNVRAPIITNDEIGEFSKQFNSMVDHIQNLMKRVVKEQKAKRKAEILALQSQINPHFLYNTLASIRYLIYTEKKETVDNIVVSLIKILRNSLSNTHEYNTIEKEIDLLKDYIYIKRSSMSYDIDVDLNISEEVLKYKIIKLSIQPIVENAFMHGLKPKKEDGKLTINGYLTEKNVIIEVIDNGVGFKLDKIKEKPTNSLGIKNVNDRIKLNFGDEYGLEISSTLNIGTKVLIRIPQIKEDEGFVYYEYIDSWWWYFN